MAIAAKFGAQDLNGNLFNYQQITAPVSGSNVIVNANFTNRQGVADARVRLALTDRPLVPMTVSSVQNLLPIAISSTSSTVAAATIQSLTISNTTASTNVLTTATIAVTATTVTTNVITCASTTTLTVGQPVIFSSGLGGLAGGTVYFVNTIPSTTTFTVSAVYGGAVFALTTATGSINVQQTTTNLTVGEPVAFTGVSFGNSLFGGILARTVYYIREIVSSTTFTVSATPSGGVVTLTTATGTMFCSASAQQSQILLDQPEHITISNTAISTNLISTATIAVTATTSTSNLITCASTTTLAKGHAVVFSGALGGLVSGTVYFVTTIASPTQFAVSLNRSDAPVNLSSASGSITVQHATSNFALNQAITFTGTTFGNIVANTVYYVKTLDSNTTFTISPTIAGPVFALTTASGTMTAGKIRPIPLVISNTTTSTNVITTASVAVTATTTITNLITCSSTSTFMVDQPVVFSGSLGGIVAGTTYYILTINSGTQFTVSLAQGGTAVPLSSATGSLNVQHSTVNLLSNQPVVFYGTAIGNLVPGTTYYVLSAVSSTTFTVSATAGPGAVFAQSTSSGSMTCFTGPSQNVYISTTNTSNQLTTQSVPVTNTTVTTNLITVANVTFLEVGMPVVFSGSLGGLVASQIFFIRSIEGPTTITVSRFLGGPVFAVTTASGSITMSMATSNMTLNQPITFGGPAFLGTVFGNIVAGTVYYVRTIDNPTTFTVSATPGGAAFTLTNAGGSGLIMGCTQLDLAVDIPNAAVAQNISIGNTSSSGNLLTTLTIPVTATTATTNLVTCDSTSLLFVGMPVQFSGSVGGIVLSTVYFIQSILNSTQFTLSATYGGAQLALSTATTSSVNLQQTTTNLSLNQPVVFSGTTFGNIVAGTLHYIKTIDSTTTFTVSTTISSGVAGTALTLTTHAGAMGVSASNTALIPQQPIVFTGAALTIISTSGTVLTVNGSTAALTVNQPVKFLGQTYGGAVAGNVYYIQAILSTSTFAISTTPNGAAVSFNTHSNVMTLQLAQGLTVEPYTSYYVRSTPATIQGNLVTVSATPTGSSLPLISSTGTTFIASNLFTVSAGSTANLTLNQPVQFIGTRFGSVIPLSAGTLGLPYLITATASSGNTITTASTANLVAGQPVVFLGTYSGRIVPFQTYYVLNPAVSGTTFTISLTPGGAAVIQTDTSSQTYFMIPAYYVKAIPSPTHVLVSATPDGPIQTFTTGTGSMTLQGQPMWGDFLEFESVIAGGGVLERTGIIVPPNTYLYASSNITGVNAIAIGIQENT
jgi:hypothetical protein